MPLVSTSSTSLRQRDRKPFVSSSFTKELFIPLNNKQNNDVEQLGQCLPSVTTRCSTSTSTSTSRIVEQHEESDKTKHNSNKVTLLWQRLPPGLRIALVLFVSALLTTVRITYLYGQLSYHSVLYSTALAMTITATYTMSAYIVVRTFWYTSTDLECAYEELDQLELQLQLQREHEQEQQQEQEDIDIENGFAAHAAVTNQDVWLNSLQYHNTSRAVAPPLANENEEGDITGLYPDVTVCYSTIQGFPAWSSTRSPDQVFELLEAVFTEFDNMAQLRGEREVVKVDGMADSYICVTGLANVDPLHAVKMARFASDCLELFQEITERLERTLGPDTSELQLRVALNSGPVTAGLLQGARTRFQLFGDTFNNAISLERTGEGNRIHLSRATANILKASKKEHWIQPRENSELGNTYWLTAAHGQVHRRQSCSYVSAVPTASVKKTARIKNHTDLDDHSHSSCDSTATTSATTVLPADKTYSFQDIMAAKEYNRIEWTTDQLAAMLKKIVARRQAIQRHDEKLGIAIKDSVLPTMTTNTKTGVGRLVLKYTPVEASVLDEVRDSLDMPRIPRGYLREEEKIDLENIELPERALEELTNYVSTVTTFYFDRNPFHNFSHASHVLQSIVKMTERINSPREAALERERSDNSLVDLVSRQQKNDASTITTRRTKKMPKKTLSREELTDHTYGIADDPLCHFAVVFAALIHDLDHPGVSNAQLVKENTRLARIYKNRSISEQNSLDMAWDLLMDPSYQCLVQTICGSLDELKRFRQLLVQTVMATDIADVELRADRNRRWELAFAKKDGTNKTDEGDSNANERPLQSELNEEKATTAQEDRNRKATIVLEHLVQASDIAHTMQHFDVFRKWNERLFREMYLAFLSGRSDKDPSEFWYKGEIGFFTFYIIPLTKKLKDCGVFGVSSDEYLNYAENNLQIWEAKGEEIVRELQEKVKMEYGAPPKVGGMAA